jgi:hypothetical protein
MKSTREDFLLALRQSRIAIHRGDIATAERWTRLAERHLDIARRQAELNATEPPRYGAAPRRPW